MGKSAIRKLLHTADLHLKKDKPETISALDKILQKAKSEKIDILTLGGDIFDTLEDANALRLELRNKFDNNPFKIIAIPGNHDVGAYKEEFDFGTDFFIINEKPKTIKEGNVAITAVPYQKTLSSEHIELLQNNVMPNKTNILLIHCTLDIGFASGDFGNEEEDYCPVSKALLSSLGYDYILAGHFHKKANIIKLNDKCTFVYPGSPVSHTTKEIGQRKAVLLDLQKRSIDTITLDSFYYDKKEIVLSPGKEDEYYSQLESWINSKKSDNCELEVIVKGFIKKSERAFKTKLEELNRNNTKITITHNYRNVSNVLKHPLFKRFKKKLEEKNIENPSRVEEKVIEAMSNLLACGELKE